VLELEEVAYACAVVWVPMIRSWRVLIPLKMADGFDSVLSSLKTTVWVPEQMQWRSTSTDAGCSMRQFTIDDGG
jgi:hypothetical protein